MGILVLVLGLATGGKMNLASASWQHFLTGRFCPGFVTTVVLACGGASLSVLLWFTQLFPTCMNASQVLVHGEVLLVCEDGYAYGNALKYLPHYYYEFVLVEGDFLQEHVTFKVFTQRCKVNKINSSNTEREKEATNHS